jgi:hypothetical protein
VDHVRDSDERSVLMHAHLRKMALLTEDGAALPQARAQITTLFSVCSRVSLAGIAVLDLREQNFAFARTCFRVALFVEQRS